MRRAGLLALAAAILATSAPPGSPGPQPGGATVTVRASRRGFQPSTLNLRRGELVHVVLSSGDGGEHCFAVDELRIEKRIAPGRETRFDFTPERAGSFVFQCCLESGDAAAAERGQLNVAE
jgi:heme/copper-type cytochrome/quinol oxidase subunit 2